MATKIEPTVRRTALAETIRVVATNVDYARLCAQSLKRLPTARNAKVKLWSFASMEDVTLPASSAQTTLFVSRLSDIKNAALDGTSVGGSAKLLLFLEGLTAEAMASRLPRLNIRDPQRLHIAADRNEQAIAELIYRLVRGLTQGFSHEGGAPTIVDAWIEADHLVLLSPSFERLEIPFEKLARHIGADRSKFASFTIDNDGRYLYWPHADAHLGWAQFRQLVDPTATLTDLQKTRDFNQRYGAAIRSLRESQRMKQADVQGVTERQLRRVEHGEQAASKATLEALAKSHGSSLEDYLNALAKHMVESE